MHQQMGTAGKRTRNRRGDGARLRVELISAAARLLQSSGTASSLTLRAVAREVGIAAPSIYRQFATRDELVEAVAADSFQRLDHVLVRAMTGVSDRAAALRACCAAYCQFGLEHPGHYQILFIAPLALDPANRPQQRPGKRVFGRLVDAVQTYIDAHGQPGDSFRIATNVWVALHGIVSLRISRPHSFPWPPMQALIDAVLTGQVGLPPPQRSPYTGDPDG